MKKENTKITNKQKNNNLLLDLLIKQNRINATLQNLLDANNMLDIDYMLISNQEYQDLEKALISVAELFYKRHKEVYNNLYGINKITDKLNTGKENNGK